MKRLFSDREAADYLGFSRSKIWLLLKANELGSVKLGNSRRIEISELDRYIDENAKPSK